MDAYNGQTREVRELKRTMIEPRVAARNSYKNIVANAIELMAPATPVELRRTTRTNIGEAMARISWLGICSLELPNGWRFEEENGVLNFFRDDGVGALQISFLKRTRLSAPTPEEAQVLAMDFLKRRNQEIASNKMHLLSIGKCPASEIEFVESPRGRPSEYWHVWHLVGRHFAAFVSYTSGAEDRDRERLERVAIVHSLHWDASRSNCTQ